MQRLQSRAYARHQGAAFPTKARILPCSLLLNPACLVLADACILVGFDTHCGCMSAEVQALRDWWRKEAQVGCVLGSQRSQVIECSIGRARVMCKQCAMCITRSVTWHERFAHTATSVPLALHQLSCTIACRHFIRHNTYARCHWGSFYVVEYAQQAAAIGSSPTASISEASSSTNAAVAAEACCVMTWCHGLRRWPHPRPTANASCGASATP